MQARTQLPWEGDASDYCGTLSRLDNSNKTARERRGKYKANKARPRTGRYASAVTDGQGNAITVASKVRERRTSQPTNIIGVRVPEVTRYAALAGAQKGVD